MDEPADDELVVHGVGLRGLDAPDKPIDAGNAGTLLRLLTGILAGQEGRFELTGDESLRARPMDRVAEPLTRMGACITTANGLPPVVVEGTDALNGIDYSLPVASAQVKSAILLAGLNADGPTTVVEPAPTRDHTELMLESAGARVRRRPSSVSVEPASRLRLDEVVVPGDFSAAAPFIVAATLLPGSELTIHDIGLNPRRTGLLDVLERMGARVSVFNRRKSGGELIGDLEVHSAELTATDIAPEEVPRLVDELPLFALAAGSRPRCQQARRRRRAEGQGIGPHRERDECPPCTRRANHGARRWLRRERSPYSADRRTDVVGRRPPHRRPRRRCGSDLARRRRDRGRRRGRYKLPRVFRPPQLSVQTMIVAIDGPAGAGKSTVARQLAERLGFHYLDTGAMYRALTWLAMQRGFDLSQGQLLGELAAANPVEFTETGRVLIADTDVTASIRKSNIDRQVPVVARHPAVRAVMRERQRELGHQGNVVIEGRDIGTVVAPDAEVKIYLNAEQSVRARRRQVERPDIGGDALATDLRLRDESDKVRMQPAPDAELIDTTSLQVEDVVERIQQLVQERLAASQR